MNKGENEHLDYLPLVMTREEAEDFLLKRGFYIPWNDCDVYVDVRDITRTIGNVVKWADETTFEKVANHIRESYPNYEKEQKICDKIIEDFRNLILGE